MRVQVAPGAVADATSGTTYNSESLYLCTTLLSIHNNQPRALNSHRKQLPMNSRISESEAPTPARNPTSGGLLVIGSQGNFCEQCGKEYARGWHLDSHVRQCRASKRALSDLLAETRTFWDSRKKRRLEMLQRESEAVPALVGRNEIDAVADDSTIHDPIAKRKPAQPIRLPARYQAIPPAPKGRALMATNSKPDRQEDTSPPIPPQSEPPASFDSNQVTHVSDPDAFGTRKTYQLPRGIDPRKLQQLTPVTSGREPGGPETGENPRSSPRDGKHEGCLGPFPNETSFWLADWYWSSGTKSLRDFQKLLHIMGRPGFSVEGVITNDWKGLFSVLGANKEDLPDDKAKWIKDEGWKLDDVIIDVPFHHKLKKPGIYPYPPAIATPEVSVYGELYSSQEFRKAYDEVQRLPSNLKNEGLERVVVGLMVWSDSTCLTDFGLAKLWPCYVSFGNESKYRRSQPSEGLCHQVAYFETISDEFFDFLKELNLGKLPTKALVTHCNRKVFHKQWSLMLDEELLHAMENGIIILCPDATIRNNGGHGCHRCLVRDTKEDLSKLGAPSDIERKQNLRNGSEDRKSVESAMEEIYSNHFAVDGTKVEALLKPRSLVPVKNAFADLAENHHFDISSALVVDLLHEFEIGRKRLEYEKESRQRLRGPPAAPAFDSLLPEPHNANVMRLLSLCAQWHALVKLRLHNDYTLDLLDYTTSLLGAAIRRFDRNTCSMYDTKELAKEAEARSRREGAGKGKNPAKRPAYLGVYTIKLHFLGDYVESIRRFGTCDSYSTEIGELCHRLPKSWYPRTDRKDYKRQISQIERRQSRLSAIRGNLQSLGSPATGDSPQNTRILDDVEYTVGGDQNTPLELNLAFSVGLGSGRHDWRAEFITKLKQHLLPRIIKALGFNPDTLDSSQWPSVNLKDNRLYGHQLMRISSPAYDPPRRNEDIIHINSPQRNFMLKNHLYTPQSSSIEHPYLYGQALGIFHANVSYVGILPNGTRCYASHRIDLVWVRWYSLHQFGKEFDLDIVQPCPLRERSTLGFIDPATVLRAVHLVPQFSAGELDESDEWGRLLPSWLPSPRRSESIWKYYYINKYVDRDMFMRYQWGMSIGHTYMFAGFPPPSLPSIPSDFDFCILAEREDAPPESTDTTSPLHGDDDPEREDDSHLSDRDPRGSESEESDLEDVGRHA
ncbi:hypothetical protein FA13DRAFT_1784905 [Coprinellus micaceus]|uniref:Uncharacterized protein n=1 Tax=Coprinellus micaceus TaxID=71717 RepID=A0A4Y7TWN6_COPMI|nr:hypothetical protein FA13DRAFT_1784905 [Coprinellus micaceus]